MLVLAAGVSSGTVGISSGEYGCSASSSVSFIAMALQVHDEGNTICVINCISLSFHQEIVSLFYTHICWYDTSNSLGSD